MFNLFQKWEAATLLPKIKRLIVIKDTTMSLAKIEVFIGGSSSYPDER